MRFFVFEIGLIDMEHTFVICAYKESKYLEECIISLKEQSYKSYIIMETSTPNDYIKGLSDKYNIPLYINEGESGITQDWNYALSQVTTRYATIAHQDDVYERDYASRIVEAMKSVKTPIIGFSDYTETRKEQKVYNTQMLKIKRLMMLPLRPRVMWTSRFVRRRVLSMGDPICCPSVCFCLDNVNRPIFNNKYRSCEDWEAWEKLSKLKGAFVYVNRPLMSHRIHEDSATTSIINDNARVEENYEMYCKFWPKVIARFINKFYTKSEESNKL